MSLGEIMLRVKGKITIALLISFLSLILCFILEGIILFYTFDTVNSDYKGYVLFFSIFVFPFCVAYVGFCLCYSGRLYVKIRGSALIVPALFGIIPIMILLALFAFPITLELDTCCKARPVDSILSELNGRENWRWANIKISGRQFQTDAEIEKEIVYGKTHGGWHTDISSEYPDSKCEWMKGYPTPKGGDIICKWKKYTN
jgi:hypothetical protein